MKYLYFVALAAVLPTASLAQEVPDHSGIAIVKKGWKMKHVTPNPVLLADPFDAVEQANTASRNARPPEAQIFAGSGNGIPPGFRREPLLPAVYADRSGGSSVYSYEIQIRNDNARSIKGILWDYVFLDPVTKVEVGRHRFLNTVELKPGKARTIGMRIVSPPTGTVDAKSAGKRTSGMFLEQIIILAVEFSDGTVWQPTGPK